MKPLSNSVVIRPVNMEDIPDLAALGNQLGYEVNPKTLVERLKVMLEKPDHAIFMAVPDGEKGAGWVHVYLVWTVESEGYAEIGGLVVDEQKRRSGIGQALMTAAEEWVRARGIKHIRLRSNIKRTEAHRFYQNIGYQIIKTQYTFYKEL